MSDNIKVAVRVRPFNKRELNVGDPECIISMKSNATTIKNLKLEGRMKDKQFFYDHSIWSFDHTDPNFVSQTDVFDRVGKVALNAAFEGYNACIFAYGQTGSGKSYTMMGSVGDEKEGLIPRLCNSLFARIESTEDQSIQFKTEVSYYEIYNERVQDLLAAGNLNSKQVLRVREHPKDGPYVENLTSCLVSGFSAIKEWMDYGIWKRARAATLMSQMSSRSHAIFTIKMTMAQMLEEGPSEIISKMHLIDLAGSERAATSGATGERLKEGGNINKSLVTLGLVISKLAEDSKSAKGPFVPYRDSVLTRLLKDSLGGNSKTFLIATISPSELNYPETLSTLYFADNAKKVKNNPEVNEDPNVKLIKDLKKEIDNLKQFIHVNQLQGDNGFLKEHNHMKAKLEEKEGQISELSKAWTERWQDLRKAIEDREMGITSNGLKLCLGSQLPHLIELDARSNRPGLVMYHIKATQLKSPYSPFLTEEIAVREYSMLLPALANLSNLTYLDIGDSNEASKESALFLQLIFECRNSLKYLCLFHLEKILTDMDIFLNCLALCTNLVELELHSTDLTAEDISLWGHTVSNMKALVELYLHSVRLYDTGFKSLCAGLAYHPTIRKLWVSEANLTSLSCDPLIHLIPTVTQLERLYVYHLKELDKEADRLLQETADEYSIKLILY